MKTKLFIPVIAFLMLVGCAKNLTPNQRYLTALKLFNTNVETYETAYQASDPITQAKWKMTIDPLIIAADVSLTAWKTALGTDNAYEKEQAWLKAKDAMLQILLVSGIIKIERRD